MLCLLKHHNFQCYSTRCSFVSATFTLEVNRVARSSRIESYGKRHTATITWFGAAKPCSKTLATMIDDDGFSLSAQSLKLYRRVRCKRYQCSNREDEKVLHRRSNANEIVFAGGKNFLPKSSTTYR